MEELNLKNRPDIQNIMALSEAEFLGWYEPRHKAVLRLLRDYELFTSIPSLNYPDNEYTLGEACTHTASHLESLQEGFRFLEAIKKNWARRHPAAANA